MERYTFQRVVLKMSMWDEWVSKVTGGATSREVGERIGHSHTTALRWMHESSPEHAIWLALAYDADMIEALVAAGLIMPADADRLNLDAALVKLSAIKLTAELHRRAVESAKRNHNLR